MTSFAKSFLIKRLILAAILGIILGGFLFYAHYQEQFYPSAKAIPHTTELVRQVKIVAFGDSLSSGHKLPAANSFPAELEKLLRIKGYNVIVKNYGDSGDTTTNGLRRLPSVLAEKPDIVIVEFGANDALKGQSMDVAYRNLVDIVRVLKAEGIKVLLAGLESPEYLTFDNIDSDFFATIANAEKVMLYPNFMKGVFDVKDNTDLVLRDRIHPSVKGTAIMAENIYPYVVGLMIDFMVKEER